MGRYSWGSRRPVLLNFFKMLEIRHHIVSQTHTEQVFQNLRTQPTSPDTKQVTLLY